MTDRQAFMVAFGQRFKALRKSCGLSLDAVALRTGLSKTAVWEIEKGRTEPRAWTVVRLAAALGVGAEKLLTGAETMSGQSPGMAWRDIASSAYRAYAASTGNKNFRGEPMPAVDALPQPIQTAWEAAVRQVDRCRMVVMGGPPVDESGWAGWVPPHVAAPHGECDACGRPNKADGSCSRDGCCNSE
jgi:transcriptional regulator with XRE-family HTH domain